MVAKERGRKRRWWRVAALTLVALVVVLAAVGWLLRDTPRRQVEQALADKLGAAVDVGALEIRGLDHFVLRELSVTKMESLPLLARAEIDQLVVRGALDEMLEGRFVELQVLGARVVLQRPGEPAPSEGEPAPFLAERVVLEAVELWPNEDAPAEERVALEGTLAGVGGAELTGALRGQVARVSPAALMPELPEELAALALEGVRFGVKRADRAEPWQLEASVETLAQGAEPLLADTTLHGTLGTDANGLPRTLELELETPSAGRLALELTGGEAGAWDAAATLSMTTLPVGEPWSAIPLPLEAKARARIVADEPLELELEATAAEWVARCEGALALEDTGERPTLLCALDALPLTALRSAMERLGAEWPALLADRRGQLAAEGTVTTPLEAAALSGRLTLREALGAEPLHLTFGLEPGKSDGEFAARVDAKHGPLEATVSGTVALDGEESRAALDFRLRRAPLAAWRHELAPFGVMAPAVLESLSGTLAASGHFEGAIASFEARVKGELASLSGTLGELVVLEGGSLTFDVTVPRGETGFDAVVDATARAALADWDPETLSASLRVEAREWGARGELEAGSIQLGELASLDLNGRWDDQRVAVGARGDGVAVAPLFARLESALGVALPEGDSLSGQAALELAAEGPLAGPWVLSGELALEEGGYASADASKAVESFGGRLALTGQWNAEGTGSLKGQGELGSFLALWDTLFVDASAWQMGLAFEAGLTAEAWEAEVRASLPGATELGLRATPGAAGGVTARLELDAPDLAASYRENAVTLLGEDSPLASLALTRGALGLELTLHADDAGRALEGQLALRGLDLEDPERGLGVLGLDVEAPLALAWDGEGALRTGEASQATGRVAWETLGLGPFLLPPLDAALHVRGDSFEVPDGIAIEMLGGKLVLESLAAHQLLGEARRFESAVRLDGLQLEELSAALEIPRLAGQLDGLLPKVTLTPTRLMVDGGGSVDVFGGRISVGEISGEDMLSRYPKLRFSAAFEEIDLLALTRTFDFGEMSGVLEGRIDECELFKNVPVRFHARFRTVERPGVARTINVKAINNIAILGTGGRVTVFDRGIQRLFDKYTYSALGIDARLEEDAFLLEGLENRGDKELFLKGRLPLPIDIVNARPGKTVSFQSMLSRLKNVDFSAATSQ